MCHVEIVSPYIVIFSSSLYYESTVVKKEISHNTVVHQHYVNFATNSVIINDLFVALFIYNIV